jgi:hypothetical protein
MRADYETAKACLQENLRNLDGRPEAELQALWNISNALLAFGDALSDLQSRVSRIERQTK